LRSTKFIGPIAAASKKDYDSFMNSCYAHVPTEGTGELNDASYSQNFFGCSFNGVLIMQIGIEELHGLNP
jgi:hypothetical protein